MIILSPKCYEDYLLLVDIFSFFILSNLYITHYFNLLCRENRNISFLLYILLRAFWNDIIPEIADFYAFMQNLNSVENSPECIYDMKSDTKYIYIYTYTYLSWYPKNDIKSLLFKLHFFNHVHQNSIVHK